MGTVVEDAHFKHGNRHWMRNTNHINYNYVVVTVHRLKLPWMKVSGPIIVGNRLCFVKDEWCFIYLPVLSIGRRK